MTDIAPNNDILKTLGCNYQIVLWYIKINLITVYRLNCVNENQIVVAVFDRNASKYLSILPPYGILLCN